MADLVESLPEEIKIKLKEKLSEIKEDPFKDEKEKLEEYEKSLKEVSKEIESGLVAISAGKA